jgi:DNA-binding transcriptional LysR family regulator
MDSRLLHCFLVVSETGNMTAAAEKLHITQPALSKTIQRLEQILGVELFDRHSGGVSLTRYGGALARRAKLIGSELMSAKAEIDAMKSGTVGVLRVGAGPLMTVLYLPRAISQLRRELPRLDIKFVSGTPDQLVPRLLQGELDLIGVALDFPDHPELVKEYLFDVDQVVVARKSHPLASRELVTPADLLEYPWVSFANDYTGASRLGSYFSANGMPQPNVTIEANSLEGVLALLREDDFLACVSQQILGYFEMLGLVPLTTRGTFWHFRAGIAYRRSNTPMPVLSAFIGHLKAMTFDS